MLETSLHEESACVLKPASPNAEQIGVSGFFSHLLTEQKTYCMEYNDLPYSLTQSPNCNLKNINRYSGLTYVWFRSVVCCVFVGESMRL